VITFDPDALRKRLAELEARMGEPGQADELIREARATRDQFQPPETPYYNIDSSSTNLTVHWCAVPLEANDPAETLRRARTTSIDAAGRPERVFHHHIDLARAWTLHGDRRRALDNLSHARRIAPHDTRHHPTVRETVLALARSDRRSIDSLAGFARWVGIAV
jgi:hypothetical protein